MFNITGSLASGPILQFPPPPPPPLNPTEGSSGSTTASSNSRGASHPASRGGSSQHLFMQHLPYHPTGGSNSSHHTSPLLHPRQGISPPQQVANANIKTSQISPTHLLVGGGGPNVQKHQGPASPNYQQTDGSDPFIHANNIIAARNQDPSKAGFDTWLNNAAGNPVMGYTTASYFPPGKRCNSPESSAMGDAEESDDKEGDESCWSEGSHGTNDNEVSTNGSMSGSMSSLNPDLNWTEAVRLMSENKWPSDSPKRPTDPSFSKFSSISDAAASSGYYPEDVSASGRVDVNSSNGGDNTETSDNLVPENGSSYYNNGINGRNSSLTHETEPLNDGNKLRRDVSHARNTSLTSPLI